MATVLGKLFQKKFKGNDYINISKRAHVSGNVGKSVVGGRIQAIYGTDPAGMRNIFFSNFTFNFCRSGPLFNLGSPDRLAAEDAVYTESILTNAGFTGFLEPITHAGKLNYFSFFIKFHLKNFPSAFYPNWGIDQPGKFINSKKRVNFKNLLKRL